MNALLDVILPWFCLNWDNCGPSLPKYIGEYRTSDLLRNGKYWVGHIQMYDRWDNIWQLVFEPVTEPYDEGHDGIRCDPQFELIDASWIEVFLAHGWTIDHDERPCLPLWVSPNIFLSQFTGEWWHDDETHDFNGPFKSKAEAEAALQRYIDWMDSPDSSYPAQVGINTYDFDDCEASPF